MPKERDTGLADIDSIKETINRERAAKPAHVPEPRTRVSAAEDAENAAAAAEADDEGEDEGEDGEEGETKPAKGKETPAKAKRDWREIKASRAAERSRLDREARTAAETRAAEVEADNKRLQALVEKLNKGEKIDGEEIKKPKSEAQILAEAEARLAAKQRAKENADRSDEAYDRGVETFGKEEFVEALSNVMGERNTDTGMFPSVQAKAEFLDQLMESVDNPERVLFLLGSDPDEAERVVGLSERRRIAAFVKLSSTRRTKQPVSDAPEPVKPINAGRATPAPVSRSTPQRLMTDAEVDAEFTRSMERRADRRRG